MRSAADRASPDGTPALAWLRRLRWVAVAGQTGAVAVARWGMDLPLPVGPLAALALAAAASNLALHFVPGRHGRDPRLLAAVLGLDVLILTGLLALTGGAANPFTTFYVVHVAMAATMLPVGPAWAVTGLCGASYGWLFTRTGPWLREEDPVCSVMLNLPQHLHVAGMLVAFVIAAACIVHFGGRLQADLRRREAELAEAREDLQRQQRFAALATLAAGAAHELGSPLGTIAVAAGEIAAATRRAGLPPELLEDAELIRDEVTRCRHILDRLQDEHADQVRTVKLDELLEELRRLLGPAAAKLELRLAPEVPGELAAPLASLAQALATLIRNAFDAAPDRPPVLVVDAADGHIRFQVEDEGPGLDPEAAEHAGEPFFTTKAPGRGMGLGLFLVRLLALRLHGRFQLQPAGARGARARLELPLPRDP